jgi:thiosulfate dehydrogenase
VVAKEQLIPIDQLDPRAGGQLYAANCASCHGDNGQGQVGPPLWGQGSFNDGAGTARVYTLAGFIRYAMPLTAPGSLSDEDAQQLAAFIDSHDRPAFAGKEQDYATGNTPVDAVYYPQRYEQNPLRGH